MLTNELDDRGTIFNKIDFNKFEEIMNNDNEVHIQQNESKQSQQQQQQQQQSGFRLQDCESKTMANNMNYHLQNPIIGNELQGNQENSFDELTSTMLNHSTTIHPRRTAMITSANNIDNIKDDISLTFSNLNINESNEKFWTLDNSTNEELMGSNQQYVDSLGQSAMPFSEQSLVQKNPAHSNQLNSNAKLSMNINYGSPVQSPFANRPPVLVPSPNSSLYNNNSNITNISNNKTAASNLNWPRSPQVQTSPNSNGLTWANAFNSSSFPSSTSTNPNNTNNGIVPQQQAWSSALYNHQQQKRNQLTNQNSSININNNNVNPKFRRQVAGSMLPSATMKNYQTCSMSGQSNIYELGSAGSDNTSSSSDSANLRENGLFFQDKSFEQTPPILDSFRQNLDPQLCDVLKSSQETTNKSMFGYACQPTMQDDKKHLKARFNRRRGKSPFFTGNDTDSMFNEFPNVSNNDPNERFSRKVFVGGLPPDIDEEEITASFRRFGNLVVDWPHKAESKSYFPPKGYAFLLFQDESSVQMLIDTCIQEDDKLYLCVSSPTMKDKPVQIRPWRLSDADYVLDASMPLDPRKTVFVGGVPRPLKAVELAMIMDRLYGGVCYAGIDTDPELKYPKGAGRVAFSNQQSYIAAISARFVQLQHADIEKRVEVKPYVLDDQICDECQGARCNGKYAPYFCANITCLQYYCENCWATIHSRPGREFHKPLVKEGADRPRAIPFRWC